MEQQVDQLSGIFRQGRLPGPPGHQTRPKTTQGHENHRQSDLQAPKINEQTQTNVKQSPTLDPFPFQQNKKQTRPTRSTRHTKQNKTPDPPNQLNNARRNARSD